MPRVVALGEKNPAHPGHYWFNSASFEVVDDTHIYILGGPVNVEEFTRKIARILDATLTGEPATVRQIAYLTSLIQGDPGAAMTIGASHNGGTPVDGLTKSQASKFIDMLKAGV